MSRTTSRLASICAPLFVSLLALFAGCATPDDSCKTNDTRVCACPGGSSSSQTCSAGEWGECACGTNPHPGGPDGGHGAQPDAAQSHVAKHGDICFSQDDCNSGTNLLCVIVHAGDTQGSCRLACSTFGNCLSDPTASKMFDSDCCDLANGTSVCANQQTVPAGVTCH